MPIRGYRVTRPKAFNVKMADDHIYLLPASPEAVNQGRILAVIDYLKRIQEK
jgi:hypothetical protein